MIDESTISPRCRQRRFAVLRFLCELESLLFVKGHIRWGVARPINKTSSTSSSTNKTPSSTNNRNKNNKRTIIVGSASVSVGNLLSPTQLLHNASISIQSLRNDVVILSNNELFLNTINNNNNNIGMTSSQSMSSTLTFVVLLKYIIAYFFFLVIPYVFVLLGSNINYVGVINFYCNHILLDNPFGLVKYVVVGRLYYKYYQIHYELVAYFVDTFVDTEYVIIFASVDIMV